MTPILAAAALGFNLVCSGTQWTGVEADRVISSKEKGEAFTDIYRVDLERGRWCFGQCTTSQPITKITDNELTLAQEGSGPPVSGATMISVNRETGYLVHLVFIGGYRFKRNAVCERAPLSGFPARKF